MRILVIDDDTELLKSVSYYLKKNDFFVDEAGDLKTAYFLATTKKYDCLVLDVDLPDGNGLKLAQLLRDHQVYSPILILSVHPDLNYKVQGLNIGADDYVVKPVAVEELIARIKSLIRRYSSLPAQAYHLGAVELDLDHHHAIINDQKISLTKMETAVASILFRFRNQTVSREDLWDKIYGEEYPLNNTLDVIISRLRKKIENGQIEIKALRGVGYMASEIKK